MPTEQVRGRLVIKNDVVAKIAGMAAREVEGVGAGSRGFRDAISSANPTDSDSDVKKGIKAEVGERQAAFDITLVVDYGYNIPMVVSEVRGKVAMRVREMTGLETTEINVEVSDVNIQERAQRVA
jgi:uncharacterized alkaline shock family protein YloU